MHPEAMEGARRMLDAIGWNAERAFMRSVPVLDIGGADINGTIHHMIGIHPFIVDVRSEPGVDYAIDCTAPGAAKRIKSFAAADYGVTPKGWPGFELVICTEVLEHVEDWRAILRTAADCLRPGGALVLTAASEGRHPHGAWGAPSPGPGEHYANIRPHELAAELFKLFEERDVEYNPNPGDVYAWARNPRRERS